RQCESVEGLTDRRVRIDAQRRTILLECEMRKIAIGDDDLIAARQVGDRIESKLLSFPLKRVGATAAGKSRYRRGIGDECVVARPADPKVGRAEGDVGQIRRVA